MDIRMSVDEGEHLPIEEVARRTGLTVRNIREFQSKGLLDPPDLTGRKGFYGPRHLARLALIRRLQDRGYALKGIRDLLQQWQEGGGIQNVLGLEDALVDRSGQSLDHAAVFALLPELWSAPGLLDRARAVELITGPDDNVYAPSAELVHVGRAFCDCGMALPYLLDELACLRDDAQRITDRFRSNFQRHIVLPLGQDLGPDELQRMTAAIAVLRKASLRAVQAVLVEALDRGGAPRRDDA